MNYYEIGKRIIMKAEKEIGSFDSILAKPESVDITKPARRRKTGLDEALEDVAVGRVFHADSVDDLFRQLEN